jgi:hypothetical protein
MLLMYLRAGNIDPHGTVIGEPNIVQPVAVVCVIGAPTNNLAPIIPIEFVFAWANCIDQGIHIKDRVEVARQKRFTAFFVVMASRRRGSHGHGRRLGKVGWRNQGQASPYGFQVTKQSLAVTTMQVLFFFEYIMSKRLGANMQSDDEPPNPRAIIGIQSQPLLRLLPNNTNLVAVWSSRTFADTESIKLLPFLWRNN